MKNIEMKYPQKFIVTTDGVSKLLQQGVTIGKTYYSCETRYNNYCVGFNVTLSVEDNSDNYALDPFDLAVFDAVTSVVVYGRNKYFDAAIVNKVLCGDEQKKLTPSRSQSINNSIQKLMKINFSVIKSFGYRVDLSFLNISNKRMLPVEMVHFENDNHGDVLYELKERLPIYEYAKFFDMILCLPISINSVAIQDTDQTIGLRSYVLKTFAVAFQGRIKGRSISFDNIYKKFNIDIGENGKAARFRIRKNIMIILDHFKTAPVNIGLGMETLIRSYKVSGTRYQRYSLIDFSLPIDEE